MHGDHPPLVGSCVASTEFSDHFQPPDVPHTCLGKYHSIVGTRTGRQGSGPRIYKMLHAG